MVSLSEESIEQIRENLNSVADTINENIDNDIQDTEKEQENKEQKVKENVVDNEKGSLSNTEKKRFTSIARIFVQEWLKAIEDIDKVRKKREQLVIRKKDSKEKVPEKNKINSDKKDKTEKEGMSWWKRIFLILSSLGLIYYLFRDKIKEWLPGFSKVVSKGIEKISEFIKSIIDTVWPVIEPYVIKFWEWIKKQSKKLWEWLKEELRLDKVMVWAEKMTKKAEKLWDEVLKWWDEINYYWELAKQKFDEITEFISSVIKWTKRILFIAKIIIGILNPVIGIIQLGTAAFTWLKDWLPSWEDIKENASEWWDNTIEFFDNIIDNTADFFGNLGSWINNKWDEFIDYGKSIIENFNPFKSSFWKATWEKTSNWFSNLFSNTEKELKEERKKELEKKSSGNIKKKSTSELLKKQEEIILKDNILETIKDICSRLNVFFSDKEGSFIDISSQILRDFRESLTHISNFIEKLQVTQEIKIDDRDTYKDNYDYSDRSSRSIINDNRITNNRDYSVEYNTVDIPAINRALNIIQDGQREEIALLTSQNDYLNKMILGMDGLGSKLSWLDPSKLTQQASNNIIPIISDLKGKMSSMYNAGDIKNVQYSLANKLL